MPSTASNTTEVSASPDSGRVRYISDDDLPLECPLPSDSLWDGHPRVFLKLDDQGKAVCPYCGTTYIKEDK